MIAQRRRRFRVSSSLSELYTDDSLSLSYAPSLFLSDLISVPPLPFAPPFDRKQQHKPVPEGKDEGDVDLVVELDTSASRLPPAEEVRVEMDDGLRVVFDVVVRSAPVSHTQSTRWEATEMISGLSNGSEESWGQVVSVKERDREVKRTAFVEPQRIRTPHAVSENRCSIVCDGRDWGDPTIAVAGVPRAQEERVGIAEVFWKFAKEQSMTKQLSAKLVSAHSIVRYIVYDRLGEAFADSRLFRMSNQILLTFLAWIRILIATRHVPFAPHLQRATFNTRFPHSASMSTSEQTDRND